MILRFSGEDNFFPFAGTTIGIAPEEQVEIPMHDHALCIILVVRLRDLRWSAVGLP